jgi:hypothetical protein
MHGVTIKMYRRILGPVYDDEKRKLKDINQ